MTREVFEMVEIDVPRCSRTFGVAPCAAALSGVTPRKCWNLRKDCGDPANYLEGAPLTLRFCKDGPIPIGTQAFPVMTKATATSSTVNIAGASPDMSSLGRRATLDVELVDFTHDDVGIDPYQAERVSGAAQFGGVGYDPEKNGTFLARLRARWPYYADKPIRKVTGYLINGALTDTQTRHFQIKEWKRGDDGRHTLTGLDVLDLANEKTALCPKPSPGFLTASMTAVDTVLTVTPTGAGAQYAAAGRICVGSEIMSYTRSGDTFTVTRGQRGTTAATHEAGDTVQEVKFWTNATLNAVAVDLITNYTATPSIYLDAAQQAIWAAEVSRWGAGIVLTTDIVTPTPVATLLSELGDLGCTIWVDDLAQKLKLRMNRPLDGETARSVTDQTAIRVESEDRDQDRLTQVLFFGKRFDPTKTLTDEANYAFKLLTVDTESFTLYGGVKSRKIFTRWQDQGDVTTMAIASTRLLRRFRDAPKRITLSLDAAEKDVALVDVISLQSDIVADSNGQVATQLLQVIGRSEPTPHHEVEVVCQAFEFDGRYGFIMPDTAPAYGAATDADKAGGGYISANSRPYFSDNGDAYRII